ncbi:putative ribonuclease H-like domain-containing protein [Tanacetum coccineum]|uniref:Ribonuclease H-like domain-containing protein n=1 Tax=Tanacetum coccineum TaxID=301880 RepID=A0ABQ4XL82_9ASTR
MIKLLEKDSVFDFNEECIKAFEMLKEKLTNAPIMVSPDWSQPFELMCDASDFTVGAVLGQCEGKHFRLGYNAVPPPYTGNFMPPKPDLSFSGLKEFVNEPIVKKPVVETSEAKASADEPKVVRKDNSAPIIEDWVSDSEEEDVPRAKIKKKSVKHSFAKIKFGKSKEQVKTPRKTTVKQVHVYVDDIIFGSTKKCLCDEFEQIMHKKFRMSSMGELTFFLGLQVQQKKDGIFIRQDKYVVDILKKFDFITVKTPSTPMEPNKALVKDEEADNSPFNLEVFSDSDYAGASLDRKSTTGGCQFLSKRLISWQCKKQTIVANSTTEAKYVVAAANCCGQVLWIQNQMLDYGFNFMNTKIYIDNESTICVVKNLVFHSKTKLIEIRHHFIRDSYEKKFIQVIKIHTDHNVADLLTKAFDVSRFNFLIASIGLLNL